MHTDNLSKHNDKLLSYTDRGLGSTLAVCGGMGHRAGITILAAFNAQINQNGDPPARRGSACGNVRNKVSPPVSTKMVIPAFRKISCPNQSATTFTKDCDGEPAVRPVLAGVKSLIVRLRRTTCTVFEWNSLTLMLICAADADVCSCPCAVVVNGFF